MTGGADFERKPVKLCYRYDIEAGTWSGLPNLRTARYFHSSCILGKHLYVFGGMKLTSDGDAEFKSHIPNSGMFERLDITTVQDPEP
mmetsp:Transcript_18406/g.21706  ORF Transcript_18406/g.21706 Transcript_18406/m.21706 type:complete len:87 (-) Transcript_18406:449-709(-)